MEHGIDMEHGTNLSSSTIILEEISNVHLKASLSFCLLPLCPN